MYEHRLYTLERIQIKRTYGQCRTWEIEKCIIRPIFNTELLKWMGNMMKGNLFYSTKYGLKEMFLLAGYSIKMRANSEWIHQETQCIKLGYADLCDDHEKERQDFEVFVFITVISPIVIQVSPWKLEIFDVQPDLLLPFVFPVCN